MNPRDRDSLFGLAIFSGEAELGDFSLSELAALEGPADLRAEIDQHWRAQKTLNQYLDEHSALLQAICSCELILADLEGAARPISHLACLTYLIEYNSKMRTTSYTDLRKNLASMLDSVTEDHAPMLITRDKGKPAAVLMSLEDYASYEETRYLLRNTRNADRLLKAVKELDEGKGTERVLAE